MAQTRIKRYQIYSLDIVNADILAGANIATSKLADGAEFVKRDGSITWTGDMNAGSHKLMNLAAPVNPNDAARLVDLQNLQAGLDFKQSVRVATTGNINLASAPGSIDGKTLSNGDRVLVKDQTTGSTNGIYDFNGSGSAMTRSSDADTSSEVTSGMYAFVEEGTVNGASAWVLSTNNPITLGTTSLTFVQFSGGGQLTVSGGLVKTGNDLKVGTASTSRIVVNANDIDLALTGVSAGTYTKVVVDVYGRISSGGTATPADIGAQPSNTLLTAIAALASNGIIVRTSSSTAAARTITGTASNILVTNGDGVSGDPTINLISTAVTPGTYQGITFDAYGRATAASNQNYYAAANFVVNEVPSGTMNGSNVTFTLANTPVTGSLELKLNGVDLQGGAGNDYTISTGTITMATAPVSTDILLATYRK